MQTVQVSSNTGSNITPSQKNSHKMKNVQKTSASSTLFAGSSYPDLKYLRRSQKEIAQTEKLENNAKQTKQNQKSNKLKSYGSQKKIVTKILAKYSKIIGKAHLQTCQIKRKKFGWVDNPEHSTQNNFLSPSRYIKMKQDYCNNVSLNGDLLHSCGHFQKQDSRKHNYRQDMFKQSKEIGLDTVKQSMRKPQLSRTRSSIQFG